MSRVPDTRSVATDYRFKAGQMLVKYSPRALSPDSIYSNASSSTVYVRLGKEIGASPTYGGQE